MKTYRDSFKLHTIAHFPSIIDIDAEVKKICADSGIQNGICLIYSHHTTCSVLLQEYSKDISYAGLEFMHQDLVDVFEKIIPTMRHEGQYMHPGPWSTQWSYENGEDKPFCINTDGHLRSLFMGRSETLPIMDGVLDTGDYGHLYFADFDQTRERDRTVQVQIIGE
ncbi:MAG: YjbQ family protein [Clostridiales bacterium]|nr:YjbQ family protein [Clostridiales bacterium]